ncbi:hypothetical protein PVAP13_5NG497586 [Panicum virgatum]|uniref:Uncharacterized protein n=1 Tax=Panicum virgatum TaxID=38727 RepID=A0A8T0S3J2_PANVG|nr:hypothetical protein PVAP13_5NG497586 [Panicum virgatum]
MQYTTEQRLLNSLKSAERMPKLKQLGAVCALLVYDVDRRTTFDSLECWLKEAKS